MAGSSEAVRKLNNTAYHCSSTTFIIPNNVANIQTFWGPPFGRRSLTVHRSAQSSENEAITSVKVDCSNERTFFLQFSHLDRLFNTFYNLWSEPGCAWLLYFLASQY